MGNPSVNPVRVSDGLLSVRRVRLFGWVIANVSFTGVPQQTATANSTAAAQNANAIATIQAFACDGRYTPFRSPALFLVPDGGQSVFDANGNLDPARLGLAHFDNSIVFATNLMFWTFDRDTTIMRFDTSSGTVQRVVVDMETPSTSQARRLDTVGQESSWMARFGIDH